MDKFEGLNINSNEYSKPLFSIIIPVYNTEKYLETCIKSIVNQDFKNYELIIIEDCSDDRSAEICLLYDEAYESIKLIKNNKNIGLSKSRNIGLAASKGQYIIFIDSDDYIDIYSLGKISKIIEEHSVDIIIGRMEGVNEDSEYRHFNKDNINSCMINKMEPGTVILHLAKSGTSLGPSVRYITKRELIFENDMKFKQILYEDQVWSAKLLTKATTFWHFNEKYYYYRLRPNSLSTTRSFQKYYDFTIIIKTLYDWSTSELRQSHKQFLYLRCAHLFKKILCEYYNFTQPDEKKYIDSFIINNNKMIKTILDYC